jgi:hypothetical protein
MDLATIRRELRGGAAKKREQTASRHPHDQGSRFADVWSAVRSDPYAELPQKRIDARQILSLETLRGIHRAAQRTLRSQADLLPPFQKLVHPVGICLRGTWRITSATPYTGYFRQGSEGLLIARASDNMGENRAGRLRFLGLAGKLYPTTDPKHTELLRPANFVMNENLIGSHTEHFVDAHLATDLLPFRMHFDPRLKLALGALVATVFALADRAADFRQSLIRQLYPIAELGEQSSAKTRAPAVMRFVGVPQNLRIDTSELREELQMKHHPDGIRYEIQVAERSSLIAPRKYVRIGEVHFTESVTSCTCDHRLHFRHPPRRH